MKGLRMTWFTFHTTQRTLSCRALSFAAVFLLSGCTTTIIREVTMLSNPPGATVYVNHQRVGTTPTPVTLKWTISYNVNTGARRTSTNLVRWELDDFEPESQVLTVTDARNHRRRDQWMLEEILKPLVQTIDVYFESTPNGATVRVGNEVAGKCPGTYPVRFTRWSARSAWPHVPVSFRLPDYETETVNLRFERARRNTPVTATLKRLVEEVTVTFQSEPPRATLRIDDGETYVTPVTVPIRFSRSTSDRAWSRPTAVFSVDDHETQSMRISYSEAKKSPQFRAKLPRIRWELPLEIVSSPDGASVSVDGKDVGTTTLHHVFTFERPDGTARWNTFGLELAKDGYRWRNPDARLESGDNPPYRGLLTLDDALRSRLDIKLELIRFVRTTVRRFIHTPEGVAIEEESVLSQVRDIEGEPTAYAATKITDARPADAFMETRIALVPGTVEIVYSFPVRQPGSVTDIFANIWKLRGQANSRLTDAFQLDLEAIVSPDGKWIYFSSDRLQPGRFNLWRIPSNGKGGFTKITDSPSSLADTEVSISPDGSRIAFTSFLRGSAPSQIWLANADGTLPTQLREGRSPSWSPDGESLVYTAPAERSADLHDRPGGHHLHGIWVMGTDGSNPTRLTSGDQLDLFPVWTPDGNRIVYASNVALNADLVRNFDIWVMNTDGTNKVRLTLNGSYDTWPCVSSDGKFVYFISNRGAQREGEESLQIWRIELQPG